MSLDDQVSASAALSGSMGSTVCPHGHDDEPCPFLLSSLHLELDAPLQLEVDCDGLPVNLAVDALTIDLVQPALGIDFEDNNWKAFPPGALNLRMHLESGLFELDHVAVNQEKLFLEAGGSWMSAGEANGLHVEFGLPCNGQLEPMKAWLELTSGDSLGGPPEATIDMPTSVTCGASVTLLSSSVTQIDVDEAHEIRVIVTDARGAVTTDTHEIDCTPP